MIPKDHDDMSIDDLIDAYLPGAEPALDPRPTVTLSISTTTTFLRVTVHVESGLLRRGRCSLDVGMTSPTLATLSVAIEVMRWLDEPARIAVSVEDRVARGILDELRGSPEWEPVIQVLVQEIGTGDHSVVMRPMGSELAN